MKRQSIDPQVRRKAGLFLCAVACAFLAGQGIHLLFHGTTPMETVRGGGRILFWGCLAAAAMARLQHARIAGIRLAIYTGAGLIVASWLY